MMNTFLVFIFTMHMFTCLWVWVADQNIFGNNNWRDANDLREAPMFQVYVSGIYWSVVTCTTVGYGDITPTNGYELVIAMFIIVIGVAVFSILLGDLSSQFMELRKESSTSEERNKQINDLDSKFNIGQRLVDQLKLYFEQNESQLDTNSSFDMGYLLTILPANLKLQLAKFLHKDTIMSIPFLQKKPDTFYLNYLEKLKPMRFDKGEVIFERGQKPRDVYFIMGGQIKNLELGRILKSGIIVGHDDIIYRRDRVDTYIAESECFSMRIDRENFEKMMKEFPEIHAQVMVECSLRQAYRKASERKHEAIFDNSRQQVHSMFAKYMLAKQIDKNATNMDKQNNDNSFALELKENDLMRRSNEFLFKDKLLEKIVKDGTVRRFRTASKNPKLKNIIAKQAQEQDCIEDLEEMLNNNSSKNVPGTKDGSSKQVDQRQPLSVNQIILANYKKKQDQSSSEDDEPKNHYISLERRQKNHNFLGTILNNRQIQQNKTGDQEVIKKMQEQMVNKLLELREQEGLSNQTRKEMITLINKSIDIIEFHKKQFKMVQKPQTYQNLPDSLQRSIDLGIVGLRSYEQMLKNMKSTMLRSQQSKDETDKLQYFNKLAQEVQAQLGDSKSKVKQLFESKDLDYTAIKQQEEFKIQQEQYQIQEEQNRNQVMQSQRQNDQDAELPSHDNSQAQIIQQETQKENPYNNIRTDLKYMQQKQPQLTISSQIQVEDYPQMSEFEQEVLNKGQNPLHNVYNFETTTTISKPQIQHKPKMGDDAMGYQQDKIAQMIQKIQEGTKLKIQNFNLDDKQ